MRRTVIAILILVELVFTSTIHAHNTTLIDSIASVQSHILAFKERGLIDISRDLNQLLRIYEDVYSSNSSQYADCLLWCAMQCAEVGDYKTSRELLTYSNKIFEKCGNGVFGGRDTIHEILRLDIESTYAQEFGREYAKMKYQEQSSRLKKEYFQDNTIYLKSLLDLSLSYAERQRYVKSQKYHSLAYSAYVNLIEQELCSLCESERRVYWNIAAQYIYKTLDVANIYSKQSIFHLSNHITSDAYNAVLLSKGILLNTTRNFEDYILNSNDSIAINYLSERKSLYVNGANQLTLDSLDYVILDVLKTNGQAFKLPHLSLTWKDVCNHLDEQDIAIEFYRTLRGEYGAIFIKKGWRYPRIISLKDLSTTDELWSCNKLLQEATIDSVKIHKELRQITRDVWPYELTKYFPKKDEGNVYFSADGDLLITSIEYLPTCSYHAKSKDTKYLTSMSDVYSIYRLSSTRELLKRNAQRSLDPIKATIYGGLSYGMDTIAMLQDSKMYSEVLTPPTRHFITPRGISIDSLPGSKIEAEKIVELIDGLDSIPNKAMAYLGKQGTETSFKSLGGKHNNLIHVATHGFFEDRIIHHNNQRIDPLLQCGLLMAGANHRWFNNPIPQGVDDGILTALEISSLDFRGLDLITLSACETGLGIIDLDGVFGLQRGLKMADANSILMSLWKVDDDATCALMVEFYKHWFAGKSKQDALQNAIHSIRSDSRWSSPKYWAAFVLLDGLN